MAGRPPGIPKTGGRQAGTPNKGTAELRSLAQAYGPMAIANLAKLSGLMPGEPGADSEQARIMATNALLDRGYGKAVQPQAGADGEGNPVVEIIYRWADPKEAKSD